MTEETLTIKVTPEMREQLERLKMIVVCDEDSDLIQMAVSLSDKLLLKEVVQQGQFYYQDPNTTEAVPVNFFFEDGEDDSEELSKSNPN